MPLHLSPPDVGSPRRPVVFLLGPSLKAVSGVSTHLNFLFSSSLGHDFDLRHFQVGSEGRQERGLGRLLRLLWSPLALAIALLRNPGAIVHLNTSLNRRAFWRDLSYLLIARLSGAKMVYQVHGGALPRQFCAGSGLPMWLLRGVLRLPDALVVLARCELEAYRAFIPGHPVMLVPNGIDCRTYAGVSRPPSPESSPLRLIYLGRLTREKGLFEALEGLALARAQGVRANLVLAGSGPEAAALQSLAAQLGVSDQVCFSGPVFDGAKRALFAANDVLLLPTHAEGLPYALLEALAAGLPAITTPVGGIPDVLGDGVHGLLVPPHDANAIAGAIIRIATDRPALERMRTACVQRIANAYSIGRVADEFARIYRGIGCLCRVDALGRP